VLVLSLVPSLVLSLASDGTRERQDSRATGFENTDEVNAEVACPGHVGYKVRKSYKNILFRPRY